MSFLIKLKQRIFASLERLFIPVERTQDKLIVLHSLQIANLNRQKTRIKNLSKVELSGFSQWGEDGIIDWLIEQLPGIPETFIEFGVENFKESNTRLLLYLRNWRGFIMDGSTEHISSIQRQDIYWRYDLTAKCAFIDKDNINELIQGSGLSGDIGLLSIDIDGNDYRVWESIDIVNPVIVVCEYNAVFGDIHALTVPYRDDFQRTRAHYSNLYFGASLAAFIKLASKKGYVFVGTNSNGCNAFFIRKDYAGFITDCLEEIKSYPSFIREARDVNGVLTFTRAEERVKIIDDQNVFDLNTESLNKLSDYETLYSDDWK